jgi:nickel transport protein
MNRSSLGCLLLFAALLLLPLSAHAHKLSIFAWPEGKEIRGEVKFSGGRQAKNVQIAVQNATNSSVLTETVCDEQGEFHVALPEQARKAQYDLLLVANGGEGHRGEWLLEAKEYLAAVGNDVPSAVSASPVLNEQQLRRIVAEEISKGLSPVRKTLAENQEHKPSLHDLLGGIGWIIGLVGITAWAQSRKNHKE